MSGKWRVECWNCSGDGELYDCLDGCCEDSESGCPDCAYACDICAGKGSYIVTELTEDNCDRAIPVNETELP